jgi:hypothetical protein
MPRFELSAGRFIAATPGGAYMASLAPDDEPGRRVLREVLAQDATPALTVDALRGWARIDDPDGAQEVLFHLQSLALVQFIEQARPAPAGTLEELLPPLLVKLSGAGRALLADDQGFYMGTAGFAHETAEELSALSADLASLHARHRALVGGNLGLVGANWALVDGAGNSQLGVWPLYIGRQRFALVVAGVPHFNQPAYVDLVWALTRRYSRIAESTPAARATG